MTSQFSKNQPTSYVKPEYKIKEDTKILDKNIALLNNDIIDMIKVNANIGSYESSVFRPKSDLGMLLFKESRTSPSVYTLNLVTLKPTAGSQNKTLLTDEIISKFN